jgi:hypothetical protein
MRDSRIAYIFVMLLAASCQTAQPEKTSMSSFVDELLRQGGVPIRIIRRILLPGDNGSTL